MTLEGNRSMAKDQNGPWIAGRKKPVAVRKMTAVVALLAVAVSSMKSAFPNRTETRTAFRFPVQSEM